MAAWPAPPARHLLLRLTYFRGVMHAPPRRSRPCYRRCTLTCILSRTTAASWATGARAASASSWRCTSSRWAPAPNRPMRASRCLWATCATLAGGQQPCCIRSLGYSLADAAEPDWLEAALASGCCLQPPSLHHPCTPPKTPPDLCAPAGPAPGAAPPVVQLQLHGAQPAGRPHARGRVLRQPAHLVRRRAQRRADAQG